jgi:hypothetical protein
VSTGLVRALKRHAWVVATIAAVLVLAMLAWRSPDRQKGLVEYQAAGTMRFIATEEVVALQIVAGPSQQRFERRAGAWQRAGTGTPVDAAVASAIEAGLRLLHNTPPERSFESATPAFGLDPPALQVRARASDGRVFEADFGATNPMGLARYMRTRSGGVDTLELIPAYVAEAWEQVAAKASP